MMTQCDYFCGWIKNDHIGKISPQMVNTRDIGGNAEEEAVNAE